MKRKEMIAICALQIRAPRFLFRCYTVKTLRISLSLPSSVLSVSICVFLYDAIHAIFSHCHTYSKSADRKSVV